MTVTIVTIVTIVTVMTALTSGSALGGQQHFRGVVVSILSCLPAQV